MSPRVRTTLVLAFFAAAMLGAAPAVPIDDTHFLSIPDDASPVLIVVLIALFTLVSEDLTVIGTGVLIAKGEFVWEIGLAGCFLGIAVGDFGLWALGRFAGRRILQWPFVSKAVSAGSLERWGRTLDTHMGKAIILSRVLPGTRLPTYLAAGILGKHTQKFVMWMLLAVGVWTPLLLVLSVLIGRPLLAFFETVLHGPYALLASFFILYIIVRLLGYETTDLGRQRLKADLKKCVAHEFWPFWFLYAPLVPWLALLGFRHKLMSPTCVNPGIPHAGGFVGESKSTICSALEGSERVLPWALIKADDEHRAERAVERIATDESLGGYPVVLKPDASERGFGVHLARSEADVRTYLGRAHEDVQIQRYHPGPIEVGVLWSRVPGAPGKADEAPGEIFSITRKTFPEVTGDGEHTLEELIWHHPRYRCQAEVFTRRFEGKLDEVIPKGEVFSLGRAGNHSQGAIFSDGADLITPELTDAFERIGQAFRNPETGGRLDFGRFDVRAESEEALKKGEGFAIVELNGALSESTNMYDPERSAIWCYRVMFAQWARVFRLGAMRRREGARPLSPGQLWRMIREHRRATRAHGVAT